LQAAISQGKKIPVMMDARSDEADWLNAPTGMLKLRLCITYTPLKLGNSVLKPLNLAF